MKAKKKNVSRTTVYEGADVFDARQALSNGEERPIGWYLQDAAQGLTRISDLLDPLDGNEGSERLQYPCTGNTMEVGDDETGSANDLGEWVGIGGSGLVIDMNSGLPWTNPQTGRQEIRLSVSAVNYGRTAGLVSEIGV
jgi:hypothetical protein